MGQLDRDGRFLHRLGYGEVYNIYTDLSFSNAYLTKHRRRITGTGKSPDTTPPTVPVRKPSFPTLRDTPNLRATWLGHACYYVEFPGGLRVLFDPVFEARCSPFTWLGPKRYTEVPCEVEDIPTVDAVIISHSHYDHLSRTLAFLRE